MRTISAEGQERIRLSGYQRFLESAKARHSDRFDYSTALATFRTQKSPAVEIFCRKHKSSFVVTPFNHLRSASGGCSRCDEEQMREFFLSREGDKFRKFFDANLSSRIEIRSKFLGMTEDLEIYCKTHNSISRHKPTHLMNNGAFGCNQCARESTGLKSRLNESEVTKKLVLILPDHIKVLSVGFNSDEGTTKIVASCAVHGRFETTVGYLNRSEHKCPKCGLEHIGYAGHRLQRLVKDGKRGRPTQIAVMEIDVFGISSMKVGVTVRTLEERYKWYLKKVFCSVRIDEIDAYILENQIRRKFGKYQDLRILKAGMRSGERWSGDTECYRFEAREEICEFISNFLKREVGHLNYENELTLYEAPTFTERSVSRDRSESNKPIAVVGVDPITNEVVQRFVSTSEATRAGFKNVSMVISEKYDRQASGGLRWFKEQEFDPSKIAPLADSERGNPRRVVCVETGEEFESITAAEKSLQNRGIRISGSHISSVCRGKREIAGGYHWRYAE